MLKTLIKIIDLFHFLMLFFPIYMVLFPNLYFDRYAKWILAFYILVPLHWVFFNGLCLGTAINLKLGAYSNTKTTSKFSETYMMWLYRPIMNIFGWKEDTLGMDKIVTLHSIINIGLVWYYTFYKVYYLLF